MVFLLIILVTGNRKMEAWQSSRHSPTWVSLWSHCPPVAAGQSVPEGTCPVQMVSSCPWPSEIPPPRQLGVAMMAQSHRVPATRQEGRPEPTPWGPAGDRRQCARCFLFLCFLSFFLLEHLGQNHCISSGGAAINPTQGQWYQSSQSSHPIMGLPSSGLSHPGQIQIWFPDSSRIT